MRSAQAILWASAFILAAWVIATAGRLPESTAQANMAVSGLNGFTMLTASSGIGTPERPIELLYVIDNQTQTLYVYTVENASDRRIVMRGGGSLANLFRAGRGG
jgi:hypothetical protein